MHIERTQTKAGDYVRALYAHEDALLTEIRETLLQRKMAINIGADEGKILQILALLCRARIIVEIGSLGGYSALWMARVLPHDGHLFTLEKNPDHAALARSFIARSDVADKITVIEGDAHITLQSLVSQAPFDMIFIDADKGGYPTYLDWAEKNIRKDGIITADNTFLFGSVWEHSPKDQAPTTWHAMRDFNQRLADAKRYHGTILPTHEGLSVAIKKF